MAKIVFRPMGHLSIQLVFCLYTLTFVIVDLTTNNLLLQKACRFNHTSEPNLTTACDDEKRGELFVVEVNTYFRFAMYTLCIIYTMFALGWSDIGRRRRTLIFLPIIGLLLQSMAGCVNTFFWTWSPYVAASLNTVFDIMSGGITLMTVASMTYMCDVTDLKSRTMELGLLFAARTFGDLVGFGSSGFVLHWVGFFYTFLICCVLSLAMLAVVVFFVKDISLQVANKPHFCQSFNLKRIAESGRIVFNPKLGYNRIIVSMLFIINTLVFFTTQGESSVQYVFLRNKFHWDEKKYSLYVIYRQVGVVLGNIFCSVVLSKMMNVHDGVIGIFAGSWDIIAVIGYLLASQDWHLYIVPIFDIFHGAAFSASAAFYSKYYTTDEFGRLQSFLCLLGLLVPVCIPAYNIIFYKTIDVFPSAYFILSIALDIVVVLLYINSYFLSRVFQSVMPVANNQNNVEPPAPVPAVPY